MNRMEWLTEDDADVSIRYQTRKYLQGEPDSALESLQAGIAQEGWGARYLAARGESGHWGKGFYNPKWTSSHYTLLELRNLELPRDNPVARETVSLILHERGLTPGQREKDPSGPVRKTGKRKISEAVTSDVCINGMFLNYACWFGADPASLEPVVDFLLAVRMPDGGFNCQSTRAYAHPVHSSLHTTLSVLEGIRSYQAGGYVYRLDELLAAAVPAREFILRHRFFRSDHTGEIIRRDFIRLACPWRWHYDILRALLYFCEAGEPYDDRMEDALGVLRGARRPDGTWPVQNKYAGEVFFNMERTGGPSRWNTLRALRVLQAYDVGGRLENGITGAPHG